MSDPLDTLVLRKVMDRLGPDMNDITVWLNGDYGERTQTEIGHMQGQIDKLTAWAETVDDKRVQRAYTRWIDFYQNALNRAKNELITQSQRKSHEQYERKCAVEDDAVAAYAEQHQIPEPPPPADS